ncbi:TetR family transcriptional regulator C-terminal domain-containing protein [Nocardia sp. CWNU-33]|uniref:TetR family transcriptional regulator C-terminal domain-containing protein n=1 Tax=Nocardia sp. CWNU-33 TaxID=3392117 RepID=UPI00398ED7FD
MIDRVHCCRNHFHQHFGVGRQRPVHLYQLHGLGSAPLLLLNRAHGLSSRTARESGRSSAVFTCRRASWGCPTASLLCASIRVPDSTVFDRTGVASGGRRVDPRSLSDARPGRVHDADGGLVQPQPILARRAEAIALGEIAPDIDPADLAFGVDSVARMAGQDALLFSDGAPYARARRIIATA